MRTYELMVIFRPTLDESAVAAETEKVAELIQSNGGTVAQTKVWGRRKLAYAIDDQLEGSYVLYYLDLAPSALEPFEFNLKLDENVLRYMIVKSEGISEAEASAETVAEPVAEATEEAVAVAEPVEAETEAAPVEETPVSEESAE